MISPRQAAVKPRVISSNSADAVQLAEVVESMLDEGPQGALELAGRSGSGKTSALAHLAALPFASSLVLIDDANTADVRAGLRQARSATTSRLVVYTAQSSLDLTKLRFRIAPWCTDDLIEYLLHVAPQRCASVMARVADQRDLGLLNGSPQIYCLVADQLAADEELPDVGEALRRGIVQMAGKDERTLRQARRYSIHRLLKEDAVAENQARAMVERGASRQLLSILARRPVEVLLSSDQIVADLRSGIWDPFPRSRLPRDLVEEIAIASRGDSSIVSRLHNLVSDQQLRSKPMIASVLHALDSSWRPKARCRDLSGAYLSAIRWDEINLQQSDLTEADFTRCGLRNANLKFADLTRTRCVNGDLSGANLSHVEAFESDFENAVLTRADMKHGQFTGARFPGANLNHVSATRADFRGADLRRASLQAARCHWCDFRSARVDELDLTAAELRGANLKGLPLRMAILEQADFTEANLAGCDLEFVDMSAARFKGADLNRAHLTGSVMPDADFSKATLTGSGLAEIEWERADLRGADLSGCTFHMGSSRSGLVGSPIAGHGSRTGFYTNDYEEKTYKSPEEIRKANLCGADLRGAFIGDVDFYLVDLRGAKYDADHADHFRRCDAILVDPS